MVYQTIPPMMDSIHHTHTFLVPKDEMRKIGTTSPSPTIVSVGSPMVSPVPSPTKELQYHGESLSSMLRASQTFALKSPSSKASSAASTGGGALLKKKAKKSKKKLKLSFLERLRNMLQHVHTNNLDHVVSWERDGTAIKVHLPQEFEEIVMPIFFTQIRFKSFQRQLLHNGFVRIQGGDDKNCYINKKFTVKTCEQEDAFCNDDEDEDGSTEDDGSQDTGSTTCCSESMKDWYDDIVAGGDGGSNDDDLLKDVEEATIAVADDATTSTTHKLINSSSSSIPLSITLCNSRRLSLSFPPSTWAITIMGDEEENENCAWSGGDDPFEKLLNMVHDPFPSISMKLI